VSVFNTREVREMKKDLVCGMEVSEKTDYTTLHGVRKMYFCSSECRSKFIHEPEKYLKAEEEAIRKQKKAA